MNRQQEIVSRYVAMGELMDSPELDTVFLESGGSSRKKGRAVRAEWLVEHVSWEELDEYVDFQYVRICSVCGRPMCWGYTDDGDCYCSRKCALTCLTEDEVDTMDRGEDGESCYTCWLD